MKFQNQMISCVISDFSSDFTQIADFFKANFVTADFCSDFLVNSVISVDGVQDFTCVRPFFREP